jgi:phosphoglycolate phosphatase-like HAD superfamily hydrolase
MTVILLDLDGVLIDSWSMVEEALLAAAAEVDVDCRASLDAFRVRMGMPLESILRELGLPSAMAPCFRKAARLRDARVRPFAGVPAMLGSLRALGLRIGVVTGKDRPRTLSILQTSGLAPLIDATVTASDAAGKPRPDGLWYCERLLGGGPALAFVGDTAVDVEAAENAGRTPLLATWGGGPPLVGRPGLRELPDPEAALVAIAAMARAARHRVA